MRVCTGSGGKTSPAAINPGMRSNIFMQLDELCSILRYVESRSSNWVSNKRSSMLVNRYESLLCCSTIAVVLRVVRTSDKDKAWLGVDSLHNKPQLLPPRLEKLLMDDLLQHKSPSCILMYPYVTSSCLRDMNMIFLSFLHL